jgi:mono/diheme cytochrome c family protein
MRRDYSPAIAVAATVVFAGAVLFAAQQTPPRASSGVPTPAVTSAARPAAQTTAAATEPVDYNWDVRPILSDNCFRCHGNDEKGRMAGLRLDQADSAYARRPGERERYAIVPGNPDASELIRRITAPSAAVRMPPAVTNKVLTAEQIEIIRRWIAQGAQYKPHWSFISAHKPPVPRVSAAGRTLTDIDRFVVQRLRRDGLTLSPDADKETLINRVSLILTGLPPTLAEVDAFLRDTSPNAYEKVVDRMLASPAYGEHMATYWGDVSRYSESDGFLDDYHDRLLWPYRDWTIAAFNNNMPFDQFGTWQLAGDLLPSRTAAQQKEQTLATAFLRVGKRTTENGAIDEEYRVEYAVDRTNTIGTAFLGMTVGCARCHDHKYDPISQKDFYSLSGFFNSTDEPGFYAPGRTGITAGPTLPWTDTETDRKIAAAEARVAEQENAYAAAVAAARRDAAAKAATLVSAPTEAAAVVRQSLQKALVAHYPFEDIEPVPADELPRSKPGNRRPAPPPIAPETSARFQSGPAPPAAPPPAASAAPIAPAPAVPRAPQAVGDPRSTVPPQGDLTGEELQQVVRRVRTLPADFVRDSLRFSASATPGMPPALVEAPNLQDGVKGKAFFFDDNNRGVLGDGVGDYERTQAFSIDVWVLPNQVYEDATVFNHREDNNTGNAGYQLQLDKNRLQFDLQHSRAGNMIRIVSREALPLKQWSRVTATYDGSSKAAGVGLYVNGARVDVDVVSDNLTRTIKPNGGGLFGGEYLGIMFGRRFRFTPMKDGAIDEFRVFNRALTPLEVKFLDEEVGRAVAQSASAADVEAVLVATDARVVTAAEALSAARSEHNQIVSVVPQVPVMGDTLKPRPTYLLIRGVYSDRGDEVQPQGLAQIFAWDASVPRNRVGLARWLFDPKHPLTSRVFVNRMWQRAYGRGLVDTSEDFGAQGSIPSHPELLDFLAVSFVESGWNVKGLIKQLVMSATFRQSSVASDELLKRDPRNILLARFGRVRMPAEMVRDHALATSGLLVRDVGGKSVYAYQPDSIWDGLAAYTYPAADKVPADSHHRRTLYSFIKRNAPHPSMANFDMPDRGTSVVRRQTSNTPLQALVLLDDPQYVEAYRTLAANVLRNSADPAAHVTTVFRLATRRYPAADEMARLRKYYDAQLARYASDAAAASALLKNGVTPVPPGLEASRLAALTNLTAVIMNTPDAYTLR